MHRRHIQKQVDAELFEAIYAEDPKRVHAALENGANPNAAITLDLPLGRVSDEDAFRAEIIERHSPLFVAGMHMNTSSFAIIDMLWLAGARFNDRDHAFVADVAKGTCDDIALAATCRSSRGIAHIGELMQRKATVTPQSLKDAYGIALVRDTYRTEFPASTVTAARQREATVTPPGSLIFESPARR